MFGKPVSVCADHETRKTAAQTTALGRGSYPHPRVILMVFASQKMNVLLRNRSRSCLVLDAAAAAAAADFVSMASKQTEGYTDTRVIGEGPEISDGANIGKRRNERNNERTKERKGTMFEKQGMLTKRKRITHTQTQTNPINHKHYEILILGVCWSCPFVGLWND